MHPIDKRIGDYLKAEGKLSPRKRQEYRRVLIGALAGLTKASDWKLALATASEEMK